MKTVDVLARVHHLLHPEVRQVWGKRQLHDDPVDLWIAIQPPHRGEELALRDETGQVDLFGSDPHVGAGLVLRAHVDPRRLIVSDEHGGEAGHHALLG
jgi:hypothetical protein